MSSVLEIRIGTEDLGFSHAVSHHGDDGCDQVGEVPGNSSVLGFQV
jgi:hypothetical protein